MTQGTPPTNGRVESAVLANEVRHMSDVLAVNTASIEALRTEVSMVRLDLAVKDEKWISHGDLHKRERGLLVGLNVVLSSIAGVVGWGK